MPLAVGYLLMANNYWLLFCDEARGASRQGVNHIHGGLMKRTIFLKMCALTLLLNIIALEPSFAQSEAAPSIMRFSSAVKDFVKKYYPSVRFETKDSSKFSLQYNTRKYSIHNPTMNGHWQDSVEEVGPQRGGIYCEIVLRVSHSKGIAFNSETQAVALVDTEGIPLPYYDGYFRGYHIRVNSEEKSRCIEVDLRCPQDCTREFLKEFHNLMDKFADYL